MDREGFYWCVVFAKTGSDLFARVCGSEEAVLCVVGNSGSRKLPSQAGWRRKGKKTKENSKHAWLTQSKISKILLLPCWAKGRDLARPGRCVCCYSHTETRFIYRAQAAVPDPSLGADLLLWSWSVVDATIVFGLVTCHLRCQSRRNRGGECREINPKAIPGWATSVS